MMELGGRCIIQKLRPTSNMRVISPQGSHPQNVALRYDVGKISTVCLVLSVIIITDAWMLHSKNGVEGKFRKVDDSRVVIENVQQW